jgi:hypothetical protein
MWEENSNLEKKIISETFASHQSPTSPMTMEDYSHMRGEKHKETTYGTAGRYKRAATI